MRYEETKKRGEPPHHLEVYCNGGPEGRQVMKISALEENAATLTGGFYMPFKFTGIKQPSGCGPKYPIYNWMPEKTFAKITANKEVALEPGNFIDEHQKLCNNEGTQISNRISANQMDKDVQALQKD